MSVASPAKAHGGAQPAGGTGRPSVCFVWTSPAIIDLLLGANTEHAGGAEVQLAMMGRELAKRGWPVTFVVCDEGQPRDVVTAEGIRVLSAYQRDGGAPVLRFWLHKLPGLWRALRRAGADVYVVRSRSWVLGATVAQARRMRARTIYWAAMRADVVRGRGGPKRALDVARHMERYGIRRADLMVVQSRGQRRRAALDLGRESVVVRNLWTLDDHGEGGKGGSGVLWVGEMRPVKQPWLCVEVARRVPEAPFVMVGGRDESDPSLFDRIRAEAEAVPNLTVVGHVPFQEVSAYFDEAQVLLCTSESEGFPNTFLQAWRWGLPVVSTVDPDEVICRHGLGCHGGDVEALAGEVARLLRRPAERAAIGERARAYVREHHSAEAVVPVLESQLMGLSEGGTAGGGTD